MEENRTELQVAKQTERLEDVKSSLPTRNQRRVHKKLLAKMAKLKPKSEKTNARTKDYLNCD